MGSLEWRGSICVQIIRNAFTAPRLGENGEFNTFYRLFTAFCCVNFLSVNFIAFYWKGYIPKLLSAISRNNGACSCNVFLLFATSQ